MKPSRPNEATVRELRALFDRYDTDKGRLQRYEQAYALHLEPYRYLGKPVRLLEIGIKEGASLRVWQEWFPQLELYAVDIDPDCRGTAGPDCKTFIGDQADPKFWVTVLPELPDNLDIVIDDGSHIAHDQQTTFDVLFPRVATGGLYVIEDLHQSQGHREAAAHDMLGWLMATARLNVWQRKYRRPPAMYAFAGAACFVTKGLR